MRLYKVFAVVMLMTLMMFSLNISSKNKQMPKVYAFGFSASFNDSTVYFTDIQEIDSVWINEKNKFLVDRNNYSYQLKNYFNVQGQPNRTCMIIYALKRKDIEKKYNKMKAKYVKRGNYDIKYLDEKSFKFVPVEITE